SITTDEKSDQWQKADRLLQKFPGREQLLTRIRSELAKQGLDFERDLRPALGPEVDLAIFDVANASDTVVGMTKPDDANKLVGILKKTDDPPKVIEKRDDGWVVFGNAQATVDRIGAAGAKLADARGYNDAVAKLPGDALATVWFGGDSILKAASS